MKIYEVKLPLVGSIVMDVRAESEADAINQAQFVEWKLRLESTHNLYIDLGDYFETPENAIQGNVHSLPLTTAEVRLSDEQDYFEDGEE